MLHSWATFLFDVRWIRTIAMSLRLTDRRSSGLWARRASAAPLSFMNFDDKFWTDKIYIPDCKVLGRAEGIFVEYVRGRIVCGLVGCGLEEISVGWSRRVTHRGGSWNIAQSELYGTVRLSRASWALLWGGAYRKQGIVSFFESWKIKRISGLKDTNCI